MSDPTPWHECRNCGQYKRPEAFRTTKRGNRASYCRACQGKRDNRRYYENRAFIIEYKMARGCADCGYRKHPSALEFDHLPQFEKHQMISRLVLGHRGPLEAEIAKCEVVCANCHRIRTAERGQPSAYWDSYRESKVAEEVGPFEQLGFDFPAA